MIPVFVDGVVFYVVFCGFSCFFFFKQKTAYEMRISDWSSDVCSSDLAGSTIKLHGPEGFAGMRAAGKLAAEVLDMLTSHVAPGVTTDELNQLAHDRIMKAGASPAPRNHRGVPKRSEEHTAVLQSLIRIS